MNRIAPLFICFLLSISIFAQEELHWKKHKKLADNLFEANQYVDAANHYETAWQQQSKNLELIYKAGECYYLIKDFKKAIQSFQHVKNENKHFPLVGLKYARSLKQDGQYQAAKDAFVYFASAYQGEDKAVITNIVANEMQGCDLGLKLSKQKVNSAIQIRHLNEQINTPAIEFAPVPYSDDLLYYSSTKNSNQANLFRSQRKEGAWQKAVIAEGLPNFPNKHFANGSFSPDAKRFYFTLCDSGEGLNSKCEIYVLKRENAKWSSPIRLHDYINIDHATTTTQPWVVHQDGQEILYFSSDREGGLGQMDIWYSTRNIGSDDIDFTYPINAGSAINTLGDEITPFYDVKTATLYFSSNGQITLGGWDIFQAKGRMNTWNTVENMGFPINSSADEFYYVLKPSGKGGFFASNRLHGAAKISTQDEDIFEFGKFEHAKSLYVVGQIMEEETALPLTEVRISLYELTTGRAKLLSSKKIVQSNYRFQVLANKNLRLIAEKPGYLKNVYDFNSNNADGSIKFTHVFSMKKSVSVLAEKAENTPNYTASTTNDLEEIVTKPKTTTPTATARSRRPAASATISIKTEPTTTPTIPSKDIEYKVQIVAVNYHDINHPRYKNVKNLGRIETEKVTDRGITRVLIADLLDKQTAENIKQQVVQYGFADAFIVRYKNGKRLGRLW